ncbi:yippee zinc-binding/DNA-binding /Mis18, centromere assembly-domain-containing protein [Lasiosphaeria ovina]|uniref:Yippee zinc-binding/DNA-binding /Mis18, centromere assembly-domain-containing protein n=1 Tax=Lasiosphaeria ovina TaxID=92902 RepID=A0AAE0JXG4_9PEZI|nr:yippee zinc-binding/DNA-binding /Mis18, centromere assembly-domain-containing protein [Lasiosphaeria ovina]
MFGDFTTSGRPAASPATDDGPMFPLYLLPSFSLPFRRRRASISSAAPPVTAQAITYDSPVPSLSSSPDSLTCLGSPTALPPSSRLSRAQPDTLRCGTCATDVAFSSQIVSKGFTGRHGRAYLVSPPQAHATPSCPGSPLNSNNAGAAAPGSVTEADLLNIRVGRSENRQLVTGAHVVADISCGVCGTKLGWKYVDARESAQKYKVGKFILETQRVVAHHGWEEAAVASSGGSSLSTAGQTEEENAAHVRTTDARGRNDDDDNGDEVIVFDSDDSDECEDIFAGVWDADVVAKRRRGKVGNLRRRTGAAA